MKDQILVVLDCKQECTRGKLDLDQDKFHTTYYDLQVQLASGMLTMKVPIYDLVYFKESSDKDDSLQYSIADITAWVNSGVVPSGTKLAMGRQFLINTYLTFTAKLNGERTISIGQLSDMGKITSTERLWLMLFGVFIVCLILLALLMKLCKKKGGDKAEDYKAVQNS